MNSAQKLQQQTQQIDIKQLLPANPIYQKSVIQLPKPQLKVQIIKNQNIQRQCLRPILRKSSQSSVDQDDHQQVHTQYQLINYYGNYKCMHLKFNNKGYNTINGSQYYSSIFIDKKYFSQNKETLTNISKLMKNLFNQEIVQTSKNTKNQIIFNSNFQSANLFSVFKKTSTEYDLLLQNDINSKGNTQWFYFSVLNLPKDIQITFNIVNLQKSDSLFNYGMQPVVLSQIGRQRYNEGWMRSGRSISYFKNNIKKQKSKKHYYTLSFKITSKYAYDRVYIAHCFPYTYTHLNEYINDIIKYERKGIILRETLAKTIAHNNIQLLTITQPNQKTKDNRKVILILARQHPGETQGSYVCQGIINFLISKSKEAIFLKKKYIFKIIPMVNPDGVIFGNYRSNLMGCDLNRKWDIPDKLGIYPQVSNIKSYISQLNKKNKIRFILDLHGHSKKLNSFFYGNPYPQNPEIVRLFPYMCSKINEKISFQDCTFSIEQMKKRAARVFLSSSYQLLNVFTFESSFYGYTKDNKKNSFTIQQYKELGSSLGIGLYYYLEHQHNIQVKTPQKSSGIYIKCLNQLKQNPLLFELSNQNQSGSQSNPEQYEISNQQSKNITTNNTLLNQQNQNNKKMMGFMKKYNKNQIRQRNSRQMRLLSLSKVDSILPDKFSLALQPTSTLAINQKQYFDQNFYQRKKIVKKQQFEKKSVFIQTSPILEQQWQTIRPSFIQEDQNINSKRKMLTFYKSKKTNYNTIDIYNNKKPSPKSKASDNQTNNQIIFIKDYSSQTILSSIFKNFRKSTLNLPEIQNKQTQRKNQMSSKSPYKRQGQDILNALVRKYLVNVKQKHLNPQKKEIYSKSLIYGQRLEDFSERGLSIKKKEIKEKKLNNYKKI